MTINLLAQFHRCEPEQSRGTEWKSYKRDRARLLVRFTHNEDCIKASSTRPTANFAESCTLRLGSCTVFGSWENIQQLLDELAHSLSRMAPCIS